MGDMANTNEWITRKEAAQIMGVHPRTIDYRVSTGKITEYRDGLNRLRFSRKEIERLLTPVAVVSTDR